MKTKTIFVVSLPRSGSTLLQSIIMSDSRVKGLSEGWLFLPLLTFDQPEKYISTYGSKAIEKAMSEYESLGVSVNLIKKLITQTFSSQLAKDIGAEIIVDKTPRYYQVLEDLVNMEDDYINLVILRRPVLEVMSSYEKTFESIFYKIPVFKNEFIDGSIALSGNFSSSTVVLTYNQLVNYTETIVAQLNNQLDLNCNLSKAQIGQRIGVFGDPKFSDKDIVQAPKSICVDWATYYYYKLRIKPKLLGLVDQEFLCEKNINVKFSFKSILNILFIPISSVIRRANLKGLRHIFKSEKYFI